jgi:hypothetical protein
LPLNLLKPRRSERRPQGEGPQVPMDPWLPTTGPARTDALVFDLDSTWAFDLWFQTHLWARSSHASSQVAVSLVPCLVNVLGVHESLWVTLPGTANRSRFCFAAEGTVPGVPAFSWSLDNQHAPGSTGSKSGCDGRLKRAQKALLGRRGGQLSLRISAHARRESHPEAAVGILKRSDFRTISRHERRRGCHAAQSDAHRRHQFS